MANFTQGERYGRAAGFLARFFPAMILLYAAILLFPQPELYAHIASFEAGALNALGVPAASQGSHIYAGNAAFVIVAECSGLVMIAMLIALFFASQSAKWKDLAVGIAFLLVFNLLRVLVTVYSGAVMGQNALDIVHPALWFVDAGVVMAIWAKSEGYF